MRQSKQTRDLPGFCCGRVEQRADATVVHVLGEARRKFVEQRPTLVEEDEVIEGDERASRIASTHPVRTDADPGNTAIDPMSGWFRPDAADADHGIEGPGPDSPHAAVNTKPATRIGISGMGALVDQRAHSDHGRR